MMKVKINNTRVREIFMADKWYTTQHEIDISLGEALRLARMPQDIEFFNNNEPYDPKWFKENKAFAFMADVDNVSGWGNVGINLIKYSKDYNISIIGRAINVNEPEITEATNRPIEASMGVVIHEQPKEQWLHSQFERKIAIVPFETTVIPHSWIARINSCKALIVPCKQNIEAFSNSGVTVPIELVHWGVDKEKYPYLTRTQDRPFTFGIMGALSIRKGIDVLIKAFTMAFPSEQNVRLICKTSNNNFVWATKDTRIKIDMTAVPHQELLHNFFKRIDCFVFPTRGEGWGLPITEAMSTGVPAIATNWSGPVEFLDPKDSYLLDYSMTPAVDFSNNVYKENCGEWAEPNVKQLAQILRHCYENRDEVREKGRLASERIHRDFTWERTANMFRNSLEKHL